MGNIDKYKNILKERGEDALRTYLNDREDKDIGECNEIIEDVKDDLKGEADDKNDELGFDKSVNGMFKVQESYDFDNGVSYDGDDEVKDSGVGKGYSNKYEEILDILKDLGKLPRDVVIDNLQSDKINKLKEEEGVEFREKTVVYDRIFKGDR